MNHSGRNIPASSAPDTGIHATILHGYSYLKAPGKHDFFLCLVSRHRLNKARSNGL